MVTRFAVALFAAASLASAADVHFGANDPPKCSIDDHGHTLVQFDNSLHAGFKCVHNEGQCTCISVASTCRALTHTSGAKIRLSGVCTPGSEAAALLAACKNGQTAVVKALIAMGVNVNASDRHSRTALIFASQYGHAEIAKMLIAAGANVDTQDKSSMSALLWAALTGGADTAHTLIAAGTHLDATNTVGKTALMLAAAGKQSCQTLITAGQTRICFEKGYPEIVDALITAGADLNARANPSWLDIHLHGASVHGDTALALARRHGQTSIIAALVAKGADD
eukprot:g3990.t1